MTRPVDLSRRRPCGCGMAPSGPRGRAGWVQRRREEYHRGAPQPLLRPDSGGYPDRRGRRQGPGPPLAHAEDGPRRTEPCSFYGVRVMVYSGGVSGVGTDRGGRWRLVLLLLGSIDVALDQCRQVQAFSFSPALPHFSLEERGGSSQPDPWVGGRGLTQGTARTKRPRLSYPCSKLRAPPIAMPSFLRGLGFVDMPRAVIRLCCHGALVSNPERWRRT